MRALPAHTRAFLQRHQHAASLAAFVLGFLWDYFTLQRIDFWFDHIVVMVYLVVSGSCIALFLACDAGRIRGRIAAGVQAYAPFVMQFFLGALFGIFFIFYARSGTWGPSEIFLGLLGVMLIGNEFFHTHYSRYVFQMSIFFIALITYAILVIPVVTGRMGAYMFLLSCLSALVVMAIFTGMLLLVAKTQVQQRLKSLLIATISITLAFQLLYFTNAIPPVPLIMKQGGVYHRVARTTEPGHFYEVEYEPAPWRGLFDETSATYHWLPGTPVYVYSSVFSPTRLDITVSHRWSFYDRAEKQWVEKSRLGFPIVGGRDGGYRGYSFKSGVSPGRWRVDVVTDRDEVIGRVDFTIIEVQEPPALTQDFR